MRVFGDYLDLYRDRILVHDARDDGSLVEIGTTSRGTSVHINHHILDVDRIICMGNVKPHYFAGFAGGRKSILPGVAGYRTIEQNHSHACDPFALPMNLEGNPVAEDMEEGARLLGDKPIFSIQTVLDQDHRLARCFSGDLKASFREAVILARTLFGVPVASRSSIVITANPYPMDINLYQSQHALENVRGIVEPGGIIILVSRCWGGVGNSAYLNALDTMREEENSGHTDYRLGDHKAVRFRQMVEHADLWMVSDLDDTTVQRSMMRPFRSIQKAVDQAVKVVEERGMIPRIRIFPMGGMTVPIMDKTLTM